MKRSLLIAAMLIFAIGCDSENKETYTLNGYWTFSGEKELCSQFLSPAHGGGEVVFETIEIKIYENEEALEADDALREESVACEEGSFAVEDLKRGTYFVTVSAMAEDPVIEIEGDAGVEEASDEEPQIRAYFESTEEVVVPAKDDEEIEFPMSIGTGSITTSWGFESGGQCNVVGVATITVDIAGQSQGNSEESGDLDCSEGLWKADDLSWDTYTVTIKGFDEDHNQTHEGAFEDSIELRPGTHISAKEGFITLYEI